MLCLANTTELGVSAGCWVWGVGCGVLGVAPVSQEQQRCHLSDPAWIRTCSSCTKQPRSCNLYCCFYPAISSMAMRN